MPVVMAPDVPSHLTDPLQRPEKALTHNRDLLELLAEYEALRRRANADRAAVVEIMANDVGAEE